MDTGTLSGQVLRNGSDAVASGVHRVQAQWEYRASGDGAFGVGEKEVGHGPQGGPVPAH